MAAQHGGQRTPAHPAPVSGPGALSKRTDGGPGDAQAMQKLPDAKYGEAADYHDIQAGSSIAGNPVPQPQGPSVVPLSAPTQRPDEPVTAGQPLGAGIGPVAAGIDTRTPNQQDAADWEKALPMLEYMANQNGASPTTRAIIRRLKGSL